MEDQRLLTLLCRLHQETREEYGAIKLWREARRRGIRCGRHRVVRLRKLGRLEAKRVGRFRIIVEQHQLPSPAPNLLQQRFVAVTMIPIRAGSLYVAVLLDLCSRRVIGWAMRDKPDQQLTLAALTMAVRQCRIRPGLIHHSDQGVSGHSIIPGCGH